MTLKGEKAPHPLIHGTKSPGSSSPHPRVLPRRGATRCTSGLGNPVGHCRAVGTSDGRGNPAGLQPIRQEHLEAPEAKKLNREGGQAPRDPEGQALARA